MKATLTVRMDNAAFGRDSEFNTIATAAPELARILRELADNLDAGRHDGQQVRDANGNLVGVFSIYD